MSANDDFFEGMYAGNPMSAGIDSFFKDDQSLEGEYYQSVRKLVQGMASGGRLSGFDLPLEAGFRVAFIGDLDSMLTYTDYPSGGLGGTVVTVRSANGDGTHLDGMVHVLWDDGKFRSVLSNHMKAEVRPTKRAKTGDPVRIVTSSLGDIGHFFVPANTRSNELVHKATNDLWSFRQDGNSYVIERLFDTNGAPLKDGR